MPNAPRPLVAVGVLGKLGFFVLSVAYCAAGDLPASALPQAAPDLVLALVFLRWARTAPRGTRAAAPAAA